MKIKKYIGSILALSIGMSLIGCSASPKPIKTEPITINVETKEVKPVVKVWQKVIKFKGNSIKTTQKFNVTSNEWRIKWSTTPVKALGDMNFQIYVNNSKGENISVAANVIGKANDESYMDKSGDYSLTINTAQDYNIIIEQNK